MQGPGTEKNVARELRFQHREPLGHVIGSDVLVDRVGFNMLVVEAGHQFAESESPADRFRSLGWGLRNSSRTWPGGL